MPENLRFPDSDRCDITILVDGKKSACRTGETVAAALLADQTVFLRQSPTARNPRGAFCMMGACQECLVRIDGSLRQACQTTVVDGMLVELDVTPPMSQSDQRGP